MYTCIYIDLGFLPIYTLKCIHSYSRHTCIRIKSCQHWDQWYHITKNSCWNSFWSSWPKNCSGAINDAISVGWCWQWCQWLNMTRKNMLHLILSCCKKCIGAIYSATIVMWHWQWHKWFHITKSHVASHFHSIDLWKAELQLMMPLASCNTDAWTNDITWPKQFSCTPFWLCWAMKCNCAIDGITWHLY